MLTVKHVDRMGNETIEEAKHVSYVPNGDGSYGQPGVHVELGQGGSAFYPVDKGGSTEDRTTPHVYVMNRFGATVAKYEL